MKEYKVLEIVLKTADQLAKEYKDWDGDISDFVSASVDISDSLNSRQVQSLHNEMQGSSFLTQNSEIYFYQSGKRQQIFVKHLKKS